MLKCLTYERFMHQRHQHLVDVNRMLMIGKSWFHKMNSNCVGTCLHHKNRWNCLLVSVDFRFEWTILRNSEISGLIVGELGQLHTEMFQVGCSDSFIQLEKIKSDILYYEEDQTFTIKTWNCIHSQNIKLHLF